MSEGLDRHFARMIDQPLAERQRITFQQGHGDLSNLYGKAFLRNQAGLDLSGLSSPHGAAAAPLGRDPSGGTGLYWDLPHLQGHSVHFGTTRSGKGVTSIIPTLLSYGGSMVVIDPKGENAWATMDRRKAMGHRVVILDPWGEVQRRYGNKANPRVEVETTSYNPLSAIDPASDDFADDVTAIAEALILASGGDSHWSESARELIGGLVALVIEQRPGIASLRDVRALVATDVELLVDAINAISEKNPNSLGSRKLRRFSAVNNETNGVRAVAATQTAILDSRRLMDAMTTDAPPFNLEDLGRQRVTLYLVLPLDRLETHGRWLRLIITMAIRSIAKLESLPEYPVLFCLDEMGTIGALRMVEQAFGLMSGVGIRISAYLQGLVQLQKDYPQSWETFISNASVIQALKVTDKTTSEYLSALMGTTTQERISGETISMRQTGGVFKKPLPGYTSMLDQVHSRPLMLPQEIRDISPKKVLNILPGVGNYLLDRMPYYAPDSIWRGMYRSPPWFADQNAKAIAEPVPEPVLAPQEPEPAMAGAMASSGGVRAWFTRLPVAGKAGVGVGCLVLLYLAAHLI